jgi:pimeloyl-ACP methyl ester carboxylesterase
MVLLDALGAVGDGGQGTMEAVIGGRLSAAAIEQFGALEESGLSTVEAAPPLIVDPSVSGPIMEDANRALAAGFLERELPSIRVPSVHVIATESPIDPDANRATAALCRDAIVVELPCGHFTWIEQPGSVTQAVRSLGLAPTASGS